MGEGGGAPLDPPLLSRKKHLRDEFSSGGRLSRLQLDPVNSNSVIWNSPLFRTHVVIIFLGFPLQSFITGYFELPLFRIIFGFPKSWK